MGEANRRKNAFVVEFLDAGAPASEPSNPKYPDGIHLDLTNNSPVQSCKLLLPYPAPRCGQLIILCRRCGLRAACTVAGRRDDPRSVRLPCKPHDMAEGTVH